GIINPKIVLPLKVVENSSSEELKYILLHELCHYKRKDIIMAWVITLVKIIYWFNPIIIVALNIMRKDCETSCDEMVINYLEKNENIKYGNTILNVIKYVNDEKYIAGTTTMVNNKKDLKERITNIAKNKKLGIKTIIGGALIILVIGGIGLTNKISSKTINLNIDSSKVKSISIGAMPAAPKEKRVLKKEDTDKIVKYINKIKLKEKEQEAVNGWEISISIEGLEEHNISVIGECFRFDGIEYSIDKKELEKLRELYNSLNYEEIEILIVEESGRLNNNGNTGYNKEFTEKFLSDGYLLRDSSQGSSIMLPKNFEAIINNVKIGELLYQRNIESKKNGYDITSYLGKEAEIHSVLVDIQEDKFQQIIGIVCEEKLVGYWLSPVYSKGSEGDRDNIYNALKYEKPYEELNYENMKKALINKKMNIEEVSSVDKSLASGYSAQIHNIKINNEDVIIYEYVDGKAAQSDVTLINEGMQAYYGNRVMDIRSIRETKNVFFSGKIISLYNGSTEDIQKALESLL
ncbi:MAG: M56 family metallopeptidase, partial [Clostridium sp.]